MVILEPFRSDRREPETHSRRTRSKLGRLPWTRQGLVFISQRNTKYGGKGENQEVEPRLGWPQVSVSPQGFPSKRIFELTPWTRFARCSQGNFLLLAGGCLKHDSPRWRTCRMSGSSDSAAALYPASFWSIPPDFSFNTRITLGARITAASRVRSMKNKKRCAKAPLLDLREGGQGLANRRARSTFTGRDDACRRNPDRFPY